MKHLKLFEEFSQNKYLLIKPIPLEEAGKGIGCAMFIDDVDKLLTVLDYSRKNGVKDAIKTEDFIHPMSFNIFTNMMGDMRAHLSDKFDSNEKMTHFYTHGLTEPLKVLNFDDYFKKNPRYNGYFGLKKFGV